MMPCPGTDKDNWSHSEPDYPVIVIVGQALTS